MNVLKTQDFETAGRAVLDFLHRRLGFDLWMITRTEGKDWIVLQREDHGYGVEPGTVFRWADSFCSQMVRENGPRIAPRSQSIPAYVVEPAGRQIPIKAFVGVPLLFEDGSRIGTLCAIHPSAQPESIVADLGLVELLAALLSSILQTELKGLEESRRYQKLKTEALTDALTRLYNRQGWNRLLAAEEERCRRYGHPAAVLMADLDDLKVVNDTQGHAAGDELIARTGSALRKAARAADVVARLGGDEFGILSAECDRIGGEALIRRVRAALAEVNVTASIGLAIRDPAVGLKGACEAADQQMYKEKREH